MDKVSVSIKPTAEAPHACAILYQLLSVAWSYPSEDFFSSLQSGEVRDLFEQTLPKLKFSQQLDEVTKDLLAGIDELLAKQDRLSLESEYINLFDNSFQGKVLHLYQHLYCGDQRTQIDILKTMNQRFQQFGIVLKKGQGVEHPDHLTVELECLAYLYARQAQNQNLAGQMATNPETYSKPIDEMLIELAWVDNLAGRFESDIKHSLYSPLMRFTQKLLHLNCQNP